MNDNRYLTKNTTAALLLALVVLVASFSMVASADDHENVVEHNVTDDGTDIGEVPYHSFVEVTGESIDAGDTYVLNDMNGDRTDIEATVDEDGKLVFNTSETGADEDPRGDWQIKSTPEGNISADDPQETTSDTVIIGEAYANVDYDVTVYEVDGDGEANYSSELGSESLTEGDKIEDYELTLDTNVTDGSDTDVVLAVSEQGETVSDESDLLSMAQVTLDVDDANHSPSGNTDVEANYIERYVFDFEIIQSLEDDRRVELDSVNTDGTVNPLQDDSRVWVGQELVLASNELDADATYEFRRASDDGGEGSELLQELSPSNSDTVNTHEFNIKTDELEKYQDDIDEEGDFFIEGPDGKIIEWNNTLEHNLDAELNKSVVNQYTDNTQVDLNISSVRNGPYDVLIDSQDVDSEELVDAEDVRDLVDEEELDGDVDVHIENETDKDNQQIRLTNVKLTDSDFTIPLEFETADEANYNFSAEVADTGVSTATDDIEVGEIDEGDATFSESKVEQNQGDMAEIKIDMSETDVATFRFTEDDDYNIEFDVIDEDGDGEATINMDTYRAGNHTEFTVEEVFNTDEDTTIESTDELPAVSGSFATGSYEMELEVNERDTDTGALVVTDRESHNIETWVMPHDKDADIEDLEEYGTQQEKVAMDDKFVVEVEASGIYSNDLITNDTTGEDLVNYEERENTDGISDELSEIGLHIKTMDAEKHDKDTTLLLEEAEVEVDAEENKFYVFFDTENENIYDNFDGDFTNVKTSEYDIDFNLSTDYNYVSDEDDEEEAHLYEDIEFVDREIRTYLERSSTDEYSLDSRYELPAVNNSTISGETDIAPYTDDIDVVLRTVESQEDGASTEFMTRDVEVDEDNQVSSKFNLSHLDVGREMEFKFRNVDSDDEYRKAVMVEADEPPEITEFSSDDTPVTEGNEVGFNLDVDSDDENLNYEWDFGDDEGTSGQSSPVYVYDEPGTYTVNVTVTDSSGESDSAETEIVVEEKPNEPPEIDQLIAPTEGDVDDKLDFIAIASDDSDSSADLNYEWDFDGEGTAQGLDAENAFSSEGTYDVEITVTDTEGEATTETTTVQITDPDAEEETDSSYEFTMTTFDDESEDNIPGVSITIFDMDGEEVDNVSTDGNGIAVSELEDGEYEIEASVDGYEDAESGTLIDGEDNEVDIPMTLEEDTSGDDDPSQPGFTGLLAAIAMMSGGLIAYRRKAN